MSHSDQNNPATSDNATVHVAADCFTLQGDEWSRLTFIAANGTCYRDVRVVPLFPITDPTHWIAICDAGGRELTCVIDPAELPDETRSFLEQELSRREFLPIIHRIVHISGNSEPCVWQVETDRGPAEFTLESEDHVRRIGDNRVSVTDSNGVRYLINDVAALDRKSRRVVDWYV